jgi:hypothetical protein
MACLALLIHGIRTRSNSSLDSFPSLKMKDQKSYSISELIFRNVVSPLLLLAIGQWFSDCQDFRYSMSKFVDL